MINAVEIHEAVNDLEKAEETKNQIDLLSLRYPKMTMDDAYAIQEAWIDKKLSLGQKIIGWKIGLTSKAMQYALNIDTPDSGVLTDKMYFENNSTIPKGYFIQPRIEAEIAFVMKSSIYGKVTREEVIAATDYVSPSLEILDTRILRSDQKTGKSRIIVDTISDNAANAGVILGDKKHKIGGIDLRRVGAVVTRNGEVEETGLGAGVLNDPIMGIVWLAERMAIYGKKIEPGQIILSGSFIRAIEAPSGSKIIGDFFNFGTVECTFD
jgi:2-oxo-hept-3-ene-1,7-dioate hydratase